MKNLRLIGSILSLIIALICASCSSNKQVFYFKNTPETSKVAVKKIEPAPVYTATTDLTVAEMAAVATPPTEEKALTKTYTKKELRKLVKTTLKSLKDTINTRKGDKRVKVSANKDRLSQLQTEAEELKNSVNVEKNDKKVTVNVKQPRTNLSQTELILVGVAALLVLLILFNIPVLGTILAVALGLAIVAVAVALLLGVIEINGF